ncbi:hypothetical protein DMA12_18345 [Amycolatopsis balhimycina DSM 5908]|uniref:Uncharacterized protein n=1 Tax=Amycolatopsis balhimycina DSM 5908 TaxID=1081091 RepID=A0A428WL91_AMYBA|nr:hypothetical protein DMA12_18345 [Amycolatopsis balhimycina DSM 5908]
MITRIARVSTSGEISAAGPSASGNGWPETWRRFGSAVQEAHGPAVFAVRSDRSRSEPGTMARPWSAAYCRTKRWPLSVIGGKVMSLTAAHA